jgi:hypothetical protein
MNTYPYRSCSSRSLQPHKLNLKNSHNRHQTPSVKGQYLENYNFVRPYLCISSTLLVPDPGKGVCADPVNRGAILEGRGLGPQGGNKERQLSPDKGRGKT